MNILVCFVLFFSFFLSFTWCEGYIIGCSPCLTCVSDTSIVFYINLMNDVSIIFNFVQVQNFIRGQKNFNENGLFLTEKGKRQFLNLVRLEDTFIYLSPLTQQKLISESHYAFRYKIYFHKTIQDISMRTSIPCFLKGAFYK